MYKNENQTFHWTESEEGLGILADLLEEAGIVEDFTLDGRLSNIQLARLFNEPLHLVLALISIENERPESKRAKLEAMGGVNAEQQSASLSPETLGDKLLARIMPPLLIEGDFWFEVE